ncbi:DedA family protein [Marinomonas sp.]
MGADLQAWLLSGQLSPAWLMLGIILLSYLLEDLAIVTAAALATQDLMLPSLALLAIFIGIASGDLGLYALGRYGQNVRWLRYRALTNRHFKVVSQKLHHRAFWNLFIIRFVPGLRTIGFTLSGFFSIPVGLFLSAVLCATSLWTGAVFAIIYYLGASVWSQTSQYQWLIIPIALGVLFLVNRLVNHSMSRGLS